MSKHRVVFFSLVAIALLAIAGISTNPQNQAQILNNGQDLIAGRNVNMTSGKTWPDPDGDKYLQRQNEPSIAVSTLNPLHLLGGANDYRSVDSWESVGELPGIPEDAAAGDAWLGVFTSYDGGQSWKSKLLPGYIDDPAPEFGDSLKGFNAASDPTVRAGIDGFFYYSGIAFDRTRNGPSVIFVARFKDYNDTESGDSIQYVDTTIIDEGTSGQFADKPWMAVDIPRDGNSKSFVYLVYSVFLGDITKTVHNKILFTRSTDGGETWERPIKLSESHHINQGTTVAIDPQNGHVYVAWRQFASGNKPHAILTARSTDYGITFSKAIEAAIIDFPFDQPTSDPQLGTIQFRTNAFPTITVDNSNRIYLAWTQRELEDGPARIVFSSITDAEWPNWPLPVRIHNDPIIVPEDFYAAGHQFMPSLTFAAGKLVIAWYDSRNSVRLRKNNYVTGKWITDNYIGDCPSPEEGDHPCHWRETIDVLIAQAEPGASNFESSSQVSRYMWAFEREKEEPYELIRDDDGKFTPVQVQFNPPNFPLFKGGTAPFIGDYLDVAPAPMFIKDAGSWRFNTGEEPADPNLPSDPFVFYISWADNRDVRPPAEDPSGTFNPWTWYVPPVPEKCDNGFNTGMRNQNIYVSKITRGIVVECPGNNKLSGEGQKAFIVNVENMTGSLKTFNLNILNPPTPPGTASFLPGGDQSSLTIDVPEHSSISRHVFVQSSSPHTTIIEVSDLTGSGFIGYVYLHLVAVGGSTGEEIELNIADEGVINWSDPQLGNLAPDKNLVHPNMFNPNMFNPNMFNPNMFNPNMFNTGVVNPNMFNPNMFNPNMFNPNMFNPNMFNPNMFNPNMFNPNMFNRPLDNADIIDKVWRVTNTGNTASSYTLKTIAGDPLPSGTYNQLLVYKIHKTPATDGETCVLQQEEHHELLVNIVDPIVNPDISTYGKIVDPELTNVDFTNATFSLSPGEEAIVLLRVIDTSKLTGPPPGGEVRTLNSSSSFDPEEYADNFGAVAISHSSTEGDLVAITLQILPDSLDPGKAGAAYTGETLRAIGGTPPYSWSLFSGALPFGMTLSAGGVISGLPKEAGDFTFTVQVTDDSSEFDTQKFTLFIDDPDPITIEMIPEPAPDGIKFSNYSPNVKFTASGGVLPYTWNLSGEPTGLGLTFISSDITGETMELTGAPQQAGDFSVTVTVTDDFRPTSQETPVNFNLCVKPLDLIISTMPSPLPEGYLGSPYDATLSVINAEATPSWVVTGLPHGLSMSSLTGDIVMITGTPTYDPNITYPEAFDIVVKVTDNFWSTCYARADEEKTFTITINPKQPAWSVEGTQDGEATAVAADSSGNVYVTGYTINDTTGKDYHTVKYDADGNKAWEMSYNGPGNGDDMPSAIAVNSSGVYVTGTSEGRTSGPDIYTVAYDAGGSIIWEDRYDGPSHLGDGANSLTLDVDGNIYVAGFVHRGKQTKHADYCLIKYSPSGEMLWDERYDSTRNGNDIATAVAVDSAGNIYVTGKSQESLNREATTHDYLTIKYNSRGRMQWQARDDGPGFGDDEPTDIAIDSSGNIYVTGYTTGGTIGADYYTVKYDANGNNLWPEGKTYNGPGNGDDAAEAIAVDSAGNAYVTGKSSGANGYDYATIKYGSDGTQLWDKRHDGGIANDEAVALAVDDSDIYVAGFITKEEDGTAADKDFFIIKYNSDGNIIWIASYDGPSEKDDVATAMVMNSGIYVAGYSEKESASTIYVVVKYEK